MGLYWSDEVVVWKRKLAGMVETWRKGESSFGNDVARSAQFGDVIYQHWFCIILPSNIYVCVLYYSNVRIRMLVRNAIHYYNLLTSKAAEFLRLAESCISILKASAIRFSAVGDVAKEPISTIN